MSGTTRRGFAAGALALGAAGVSQPAFARGYGTLSLDSAGCDSFAGHRWGVQRAAVPYAIQENAAFNPRRHRFEVRDGDRWKSEAYVNRAEFGCHTKHPYGQDVWFAYAMRVRAGADVSGWNVLGQFHQTEDGGEAGVPPPFAVYLMPGNKLKFSRRYNPLPLDSQPIVSTLYTRTIARDRWYRLVGAIRFGWEGDGSVRLWIDGVKVVGLSNIDIGYNDAVGPYWKFGIYRRLAPETLVVEYANFELGSSSLYSRVTSPLPL